MARSSAVLKMVEVPEAKEKTLADWMKELSANFQAQQPFKQKLKKLEDEAKPIKAAVLPLLDREGIRKTSTKTETVSITERSGFVIKDVESLLKFLKRKGFMHVLKLDTESTQELYDRLDGQPIPGVEKVVTTRYITVSGIK